MADASGSVPAPGAGPRTATAASPGSQSGPDPLIGRVINDRFRIVALIARGGMGKVYRAEQAPLGREVALKVLNPNYSGDSDPEFHRRFFLEASICSKLTHPNTVTIFDYGRTDDDVYYIAMELLEGKTLHRALREGGTFEPQRAVHIARQICRSLREAHSLGVIHRDLKPANVYLVRHGDESDFAKVLDFGLVKNLEDKGEDLTQTGLFMGSPKYMSPEQIRGEKVDARADIYALSVILYEMLVGKVPFDRPNSVNILMAHVHEQPPTFAEANPEVHVSALLEQVVMKGMAKKPEERFASMDELLNTLKQVSTDVGLGMSGSREIGAMSGEFQTVGVTGAFAAVALKGDPLASSSSTRSAGAALSSVAMSSVGGSGSLPTVASSSAPVLEAAQPRRTGLYVIIAALLALLAAMAVALVVNRPAREPIVSLPETPSTTTTAEPEPTRTHVGAGAGALGTTAPPPIARTQVSLRSIPVGAMVHVGDREYGPTPADIEWTGEEAARGREVTFVFELAGHRDFTVTRTITSDVLDVSAQLASLPVDRPFRPRPPRPRTDEDEDGTGPIGPIKGYKLDPY